MFASYTIKYLREIYPSSFLRRKKRSEAIKRNETVKARKFGEKCEARTKQVTAIKNST